MIMMNRLRVVMTTTSWTILKQLRRQGNSNPGFCRCLMMTSQRKLPAGKDDPLDPLKENPYYQKYATKLKDKQLYVFHFKYVLRYMSSLSCTFVSRPRWSNNLMDKRLSDNYQFMPIKFQHFNMKTGPTFWRTLKTVI